MTERDVPFLQGGNYTATEVRRIVTALLGARDFVDLAPSTSPLVSAGGGHGVVGSGDMAVTAGAGTSVNVSLGVAAVRGTQQSDQGVYITSNDATANKVISAADATNPRKDLVVTRVKDNEFGIAGDNGPIEVVTGTPTGGLTAGNATGRPTPPENALVLAEVFVPAGAASSASYTITDLRTFAYALGGACVCKSTTRPDPAFEGLRIIETDTGRELIYSGSKWVRLSWYKTSGRTGCKISRNAAQSIANNSGTYITFDAEDWDSDGFFAPSSTTATVPADLDGEYLLGGRVFLASTGAFSGLLRIDVGGTNARNYAVGQYGAVADWAIGMPIPLVAGNTIKLLSVQVSGAAVNVTAQLELVRAGGPT